MKVLVVGDGLVASSTVTALLGDGHEVRLMAPRADTAIRRWPRGVEAWPGDVALGRNVTGAAEGCEVVLHLSALREPWTGGGRPPAGEARVDVRGTRLLVSEAGRAGAARFVLLSSSPHVRTSSDVGRALRQAEGVAKTFRGVWTVLRSGLVYGPGEGALAALALMVRTLPAVPLVDGGRRELQPLWHEDLGRALARAAVAPEAAGRELHAAGPERVRLAEVMDRLSAITGRKPARIAVPSLLASLGAEAAGLLGVKLPARAAALAELDGELVLPPSIENALTAVLGVEPTLVEQGLSRLVEDVPEQAPVRRAQAVVRRRLWVDIEGSTRTARALRDIVRRQATHVFGLEDGPPEGQMIKKGALLSARVPMRGLVALRLVEVTPERLTAITVEGDPLAAVADISFQATDRGLRVEVRIDGEATTMVDRVLLRTAGGLLEDLDWTGILDRVVGVSGGRAAGPIGREVVTLDEDEAGRVRDRAERLTSRLTREKAPAKPDRPRSRTAGARRSRPAVRRPRA